MHRMVDGKRVEMTPEEEREWQEESDRNMEQAHATKYMNERRARYPGYDEQFDMLWHELDKVGVISKTGQWYKAIKKVKDDNPKPQG